MRSECFFFMFVVMTVDQWLYKQVLPKKAGGSSRESGNRWKVDR